MKEQVLSIEQMQHLQDFGVDTSKASMVWTYIEDKKNPENKSASSLCVNGENKCWENSSLRTGCVPTFTLQDILDNLPLYADWNPLIIVGNAVMYSAGYGEGYDSVVKFEEDSLLQSAYKMLCWVIENGYLKGGWK